MEDLHDSKGLRNTSKVIDDQRYKRRALGKVDGRDAAEDRGLGDGRGGIVKD